MRLDNVFLIVSKDRRMIAKGTPSKRFICLIEGDTKKRILTYSSKAMAENALVSSGFFLSDKVKQLLSEELPEQVTKEGFIFWNDMIESMFEVVEYKIELTEIK